MKTLPKWTSLALAALLPLAAAAQMRTDKSEPPKRLASFEMTRPRPSEGVVAARVSAAGEAITGRKMTRALPAKSAAAQVGRSSWQLPEAPGLEIAYLPDYDELRMVDTELAASTAPVRDIGQDEAVAAAKRTFEELARRKVVNTDDYAWDRADVASTWVGGGSSDGKFTEQRRRIEYRITVRRQLNGIEVANAGIRIGVHASGRVSAVRMGGPVIASKRGTAGEEPTGSGRWIDRKVGIEQLDARFEREVVPAKAKANVAWARVLYVMPEDQRSAVVEPLYVVSYSLHMPTDDGQIAISRRKTVGFSLSDPGAKPVDLTPPAKQHEVDKEPKVVPAAGQ